MVLMSVPAPLRTECGKERLGLDGMQVCIFGKVQETTHIDI